MNDAGGCWVVGSIRSAFWLRLGVRVVRRAVGVGVVRRAVGLFGGEEVERGVVLGGWVKGRVVRRAVGLFGGKEVEGVFIIGGWGKGDVRACGRDVVGWTDRGRRMSLELDLSVEGFGM